MTTPRPCAAAEALSVVGEKYSLLVLREIFFGVRRFDGIARNTGAPRDVLTARLRHLVDAEVITKVQYHERPPRFEYHLTDAGQELRPVLLLLTQWGDRHLVDRPPVVWEHHCGTDLEPVVSCRDCGEEIGPGQLTPRFASPEWTAAGHLDVAGS
ncbi:helix-turn-helix transcriptional regulator [Solihabitans fulvus]|uniref:Helix-turn-helix transcriptional regulator n=1 Tax=Solihabitans fulvus TaxID=1892852 RepID=A0A5B2X014_9PSEU|nr:helix-turn-helix domain-containing protein [Solihabitans fulvus]KAA2256109.1 helix-turn-helix transcriptional regulator [Solihabitans fulvus]